MYSFGKNGDFTPPKMDDTGDYDEWNNTGDLNEKDIVFYRNNNGDFVEKKLPDSYGERDNIPLPQIDSDNKEQGVLEQFGRGLVSSYHDGISTLKGAGALGFDLVHDLTGSEFAEEKRNFLFDSAKESMNKSADYAPEVTDIRDIDSFKDSAKWVLGNLGAFVPSAVEASVAFLGSGGLGGIVGKQLLKESIERKLKKEMKQGVGRELRQKILEREMSKGVKKEVAEVVAEKAVIEKSKKKVLEKLVKDASTTGLVVNSTAHSAGSMYLNDAKTRGIDEADPVSALTFGSILTGLETFSPFFNFLHGIKMGNNPATKTIKHKMVDFGKDLVKDASVTTGQTFIDNLHKEVTTPGTQGVGDKWDYLNGLASNLLGTSSLGSAKQINSKKYRLPNGRRAESTESGFVSKENVGPEPTDLERKSFEDNFFEEKNRLDGEAVVGGNPQNSNQDKYLLTDFENSKENQGFVLSEPIDDVNSPNPAAKNPKEKQTFFEDDSLILSRSGEPFKKSGILLKKKNLENQGIDIEIIDLGNKQYGYKILKENSLSGALKDDSSLQNFSKQEDGDVALYQDNKVDKDNSLVDSVLDISDDLVEKVDTGSKNGTKKDISSAQRHISLLSHYAKEIPALKKMFNHALDIKNQKYDLEQKILYKNEKPIFAEIAKFGRKKSRESSKLKKYLYDQSRSQSGYFVDFDSKDKVYRIIEPGSKKIDFSSSFSSKKEALDQAIALECADWIKKGGSKEGAQALSSFRKISHNMVDQFSQELKYFIGVMEKQVVDSPDKATITKYNSKILRLKKSLADLEKSRGFFFPIVKNSSGFILNARKKGAASYSNFYSFQSNALEKRRALEKKGYSVSLNEAKKNVDDLYEKAGQIAIEKVFGGDLSKGKRSKEALQNFELAFVDAVVDSLDDPIENKSFRARVFSNPNEMGFDVSNNHISDPTQAILLAASSITRGESKRVTISNMANAMAGTDISLDNFKKNNPESTLNDYLSFVEKRKINRVDQRNAFNEGKKLLHDFSKNESSIEFATDKLKEVVLLKKTAFSVVGPAVNLSHMFTSVPACLNGYGNIPIKKVPLYLAKASKEYGKYKFHSKYPSKTGAPSKESIKLFNEIENRGWSAPKVNKEIIKELESEAGKAWRNSIEKSTTLMSATEQYNRVATIASGYYGLKDQAQKAFSKNLPFKINGKKFSSWNEKAHEAALDQAKYMSDMAHGVNDDINKPLITKGKNPVSRAVDLSYATKSFMHNYMLTAYDLGFNTKHGKNAAVWMMVSPTILGGATASVPGKVIVEAIGKSLGSENPEEDFYEYVADNYGDKAERVSRYGILGMSPNGISIKDSLDTGKFKEPFSLKSFSGVQGDVVKDFYQGYDSLKKGDIRKAATKFAPDFISNPLNSYEEYSQGFKSDTGLPVFHKNEEIKPDLKDSIYRAGGFNSSKFAQKVDLASSSQNIKSKYDSKRFDIFRRLKDYFSIPENERNQNIYFEILNDIERYNKVAQKRSEIPMITSARIKNSLKRTLAH